MGDYQMKKDGLPYGVTRNKGSFQASVSHNGLQVYLGTYPDMDDAVAAVAAYREKNPANPRGGVVVDNRKIASNKRPSMRAAINAKCKDCIYDKEGVGTWRAQVGACTSTDCPLYVVRPKSITRKVIKDDNE